MKAVILAGGLGTRLVEETEVRPKPMVEIGGRPILWHILKHLAHHGIREFYVALGYRGDFIKRYFLDYCNLNGSMTLHMAAGRVAEVNREVEDWVLHLIDTGLETQTGGRVKRLQSFLRDDAPFLVTYGDGVCDVDVGALVAFHRSQRRLATVTAVRPPARFGAIVLDREARLVEGFSEKPQAGEGWINGGYMVLEAGAFDYLAGDRSVLEVDLLERLAAERQLAAYRHAGFWQCMDTLRDKRTLESLWTSGRAAWKVWT